MMESISSLISVPLHSRGGVLEHSLRWTSSFTCSVFLTHLSHSLQATQTIATLTSGGGADGELDANTTSRRLLPQPRVSACCHGAWGVCANARHSSSCRGDGGSSKAQTGSRASTPEGDDENEKQGRALLQRSGHFDGHHFHNPFASARVPRWLDMHWPLSFGGYGAPAGTRKGDRKLLQPVRPTWGHSEALPQPSILATWLGHASTLVELPMAGSTVFVLIDPIFSHRAGPSPCLGIGRHVEAPCQVVDLPGCHVVLISHNQ